MPTEMELKLEQTQQGVSYEVSNIRVISFTIKMEILLEPTSNKLMVEHAEFDESDTHVLERFDTSVGNPVKDILLNLNLPDHRILKDRGEVKEFKKDGYIKAFQVNKSERYGACRSMKSQDHMVGKIFQMETNEIMLELDDFKVVSRSQSRQPKYKLRHNVYDHYIKPQDYMNEVLNSFKTNVKA
ncbi:hypothetical protein Tco_1371281 [Tanacetum coccineum]